MDQNPFWRGFLCKTEGISDHLAAGHANSIWIAHVFSIFKLKQMDAFCIRKVAELLVGLLIEITFQNRLSILVIRSASTREHTARWRPKKLMNIG